MRRSWTTAVWKVALVGAVLDWSAIAMAQSTPAAAEPPATQAAETAAPGSPRDSSASPPETAKEPSPSPAPERPATALELHDEALALYARGDYQESRAKLAEAIRLDPKAKLLHYNLGLVAEKIGDLDTALTHYRECLNLETNRSERVAIARIVKRIEGARARVPRRYQDQGEGDAIVSGNLAPRAADVSTFRAVSYVGFGVATAGLVAGGVLAGLAHSADPGSSPETSVELPFGQIEKDARRAHRLAIGADVSFGIAGAAVLGSVVMLLLDDDDDSDDVDLIALRGLSVSHRGAEVSWSF